MTKKSYRLLSLFLALFLSCCLFFPAGRRNDWPLWLYPVAFVVFIAAICYWSWDRPELAFKGIPVDKLTGKDVAVHWGSFFLLLISVYFIVGMFGSEWWLVLIGLAVFLAYISIQKAEFNLTVQQHYRM